MFNRIQVFVLIIVRERNAFFSIEMYSDHLLSENAF